MTTTTIAVEHGLTTTDVPPAEPAAGSLAVWQTEPCPTWCTWGTANGRHGDGEHPEDRDHAGLIGEVPMRRARAVEMGEGEWQLATWKVYLRQPLDAKPFVHMFNDDDRLIELELCPDEASTLARLLIDAVEAAR